MSDVLTLLVAAIAMRAHDARVQEETRARLEAAQMAKAAECMQEALYFEARGEGVTGMVAVADVVLNREPDYGGVCEVVHAPGQFTYTRHRVRDQESWELAAAIAGDAVEGKLPDLTHGATHYHAVYVHPDWADTGELRLTTTIGQHRFYRPAAHTVRVASR